MGSKRKNIVVIILALLVGAVFLIRYCNVAMTAPPDRSSQDATKLAECPDTNNCVGSMEEEESKKIEPIELEEPEASRDVLTKVESVIESMGGRVVNRHGRYIHAEFTSLIFGFIDDVEFLFMDDGVTLHMRSASRVGNSDMGVNRKRMEEFRKRFIASKPEEGADDEGETPAT